MGKQTGLKPQDIAVLLKIASNRNRKWRLIDLAQELGISVSEVSMALERSRYAGFMDQSKRHLSNSALLEFLIHGVKYVYHAQPGPISRGIPTAHSAPPLSGEFITAPEDCYVWPDSTGNARGQSIEPLYPSVPRHAVSDRPFYELLALVDAIRVGRARERKLAEEKLSKRLSYE